MKRNAVSSEEVAIKVFRNCEPTGTRINGLPPELLAEILSKIPPSDRLKSALTCRYWAAVVSSQSLLGDVRLTIRGDGMRIAAPILMRSKRQYRHLRIFRANLGGYRSDLWAKVGKHLRELEIDGCRLGPVELHSILAHCPVLEVLKIRAYSPRGNVSPVMLHALGKFDLDEIRESMRNVRHLLLNFVISERELEHMVSLMPNITSLILSSGTKTDYCLPGTHSPLRDVPYCTLTTSHVLTKLDFLDVRLHDAQVNLLMAAYSDILQEVRLNTFYLTGKAYEAVARCTKLEHLYLPIANELKENHMRTLAWNSRNLYTLDLSYCDHLTEACVPDLLSLKELRHVSLLGCKGISRSGLRGLATIPNLEYLNLQDTKFEKEDISSLKHQKNLRFLILDAEIDSQSFALICEQFKKLKKLKLLACETLTDEDAANLQRMQHLDDLHMRIGVGFTDSTFEKPLGSAAMEGLFLDGCPMTDVGLAGIASNHGRLKHLVLSDCLRVTDAGLAYLVENEPMLEKLELFYCDSVRGPFLAVLAHACPRLERVIFSECPVSDVAVKTFRNQRPHVMVEYDD